MKKIIKFIVLIGVLALIAIFVVKAKNYYNGRYVGKSYYAMVPSDQSTNAEMIYDDKGDEIGKGIKYELKSYDEKKERILVFTVYKEKPEELLQPGTFLEIEASDKIVLGEKIIKREDVPEDILEKIEANK